jgi:hypothetical protein
MNRLRAALRRLLRGPAACRFLERIGIDSRRYWLLIDLFNQLAERREMLGHLGSNRSALRLNAGILCAMTALAAVFAVISNISLEKYLFLFMGMTALLTTGMLFSEAGNSLVNPTEGLVLSHQPINGATYTGAKLTHLARVLLYLIPALNAIPALCSLFLGAPWYYPLVHMMIGFMIGTVIGLTCCAIFGWLIRFIPARRLKAAGQIAEVVPWSLFVFFQNSQRVFRHVHLSRFFTVSRSMAIGIAAAVAVVGVCAVIMGLRCLSGDYLVRISAIAHGSSGNKAKIRRSPTSDFVARFFGGPGSRGGFEYLSRMMRRDWQFRRQLIPLLPSMAGIIAFSVSSWHSPFSGRFSSAHVLPHLFGVMLFFVCPLLIYGSDYKGTWLFLLAPTGVFAAFTRGIYAWLWIRVIVMPHAIVLLLTSWFWGLPQGLMFTAYSLAVGSTYLSLEMRLIEGMPFSKQPEPTRQNYLLPIMMLASLVIAAVIGIQYFLIFRSYAAVCAVTVMLAIAAVFLTRNAFDTVETAIRFQLGILSQEAKPLYTEVE